MIDKLDKNTYLYKDLTYSVLMVTDILKNHTIIKNEVAEEFEENLLDCADTWVAPGEFDFNKLMFQTSKDVRNAFLCRADRENEYILPYIHHTIVKKLEEKERLDTNLGLTITP